MTRDITPPASGGSVGTPSEPWADVVATGDITDGTNASSALEIKGAVDHAAITDGSNPHATVTTASTDGTLDGDGSVGDPLTIVVDGHIQTLSTIADAGTGAALDVAVSGDAAAGQLVKGNDTRLDDVRPVFTDGTIDGDGTSGDALSVVNDSHTHTLSNVTDSGTAASLDVAGLGDASASEVVKGDDTRLSDSRVPTSHAASHELAGVDAVDHDNLVSFEANKHIDHTTVGIRNGTDFTGGGAMDDWLDLELSTTGVTAGVYALLGATVDGKGRISQATEVVDLPAQDSIQLDPQSTPPAHSEGLFYYDAVENCIVSYNNEAEVSQCLGRETFAYCYNDTGATLTNGVVVYINGAFGGRPTIDKADATAKQSSRIIGMATHDIENGTYGYVTVRGIVNGINTSSFATGDTVYVDPANPGELINTRPTAENYELEVGTILTSDASAGNIYIQPQISELTVEMSRHKGFPANNADEATLSFVDGTRTFSITPVGAEFHFYQEGTKYTKTSAESIVISNVTGEHFVYFDDGVISEMVNPTVSQIIDLILNKPFIGYVYWNASESASVIVAEERHKTQTTDGFTPAGHAYTHIHEGAKYTFGLTPSTVGTGGGGSSNADAQWGVGAGSIADEDINININAIGSTTGIDYIYRSGLNGDWIRENNAPFNFPYGATPLPQWNEFTGGTYQLTEVTSGDYVLYHMFGINSIDEDNNAIIVPGDSEYATISLAQEAAKTAIYDFDRSGMPFQEFVPIATFIMEGKTAFVNTPQGRLIVTADGGDYEDFRVAIGQPSSGASATDHNALTGLQGGASAEYYHTTLEGYNNEATFMVAASDETTDLTTGASKLTFPMPYAMTLTGIKAGVKTAPTGATITVDVNESGTTILSTKLTIDATEKTSVTAATPVVISDSALADDAEITIDIDQVGSTIAGKGLKITFIGTHV